MKKLCTLLVGFLLISQAFAQQGFPFESEIRAFKHQDSVDFPKPNGILFIGSSSIRKWTDLEQRFPDVNIIRRGVGGCELWQIVDYYTPFIVFPYHPRKIFIYAGENDIAAGRTGKFVSDEFEKLYGMLTQKLPGAEIYFLSIKPSPSRIRYFAEVDMANDLIERFLKNKPKSHFIDVGTVLYEAGTTVPDYTLFEADYLHLSKKGYDKWQKVLQPYIK